MAKGGLGVILKPLPAFTIAWTRGIGCIWRRGGWRGVGVFWNLLEEQWHRITVFGVKSSGKTRENLNLSECFPYLHNQIRKSCWFQIFIVSYWYCRFHCFLKSVLNVFHAETLWVRTISECYFLIRHFFFPTAYILSFWHGSPDGRFLRNILLSEEPSSTVSFNPCGTDKSRSMVHSRF